MALERYREKRDFNATPEPRGRVVPRRALDLSFVIQKHAASHLHYDFRLELDGVLLSWAVPKGPSLDPADKRLAMHVEDHPLDYGDFEGTIPAKQYGGGTVLLWDRGVWIPKGDPAADYRKGHLKFELVGEKLRGGWALVRTQGSKYGGNGKQAWLLIKERDDFARSARHGKIVDDQPDSVLSGRSMEQIANDRERVWHSNRSVASNVQGGALKRRREANEAAPASSHVDPGAVGGAKKAKLPGTLSPQLATLGDACPPGDGWLHEVKYDGYRMVCRIDRGKVGIYSRNGKDWTAALTPVAAAVKRLRIRSAWLDGEVVVMTPDGRTSFQRLQNALADPSVGALTYFVFDVPFLDGYDLRAVKLSERKRLLRSILPDADPRLRYGIEIQGSGDQFFAQACKLGLEGAVSKRVDSLYQPGARTRDWLKVKCGQRQEMVIGGFTDPQGSRTGFGALLLGVYEVDGTLRYSGRVGTGFDDATLESLRHTLDKLVEKKSSFANPPRGYAAKGVHWVQPALVAEVAFTEWTQDGTLRHPSFQRLRKDKKAEEVMRERASKEPPVTVAPAADAPRRSARAATRTGERAGPAIAGITLSHPDKLLFPEDKLTKRDVAKYYKTVSTWMVPHLRDRPLSLVRCPDGWQAQCFYQKHADKSVNGAVDRIDVPQGDGSATYFAANSTAAIVALLQWGVIEIHPWGSRNPALDRPDRLIFDFDPDDTVAWRDLVDAVRVMRTLLDGLRLKGFLKTTGGKGLHIVVPIRPTIAWDVAKGFTKAVANILVSTFPDRFTVTLSKAQRKGKIFIDYLRNDLGATAVAPYSVRAREHAPVATPIAWEELARDVRFAYFNVSNVPTRLGRLKHDPWAAFLDVRQSITKPMMKRVGFTPK